MRTLTGLRHNAGVAKWLRGVLAAVMVLLLPGTTAKAQPVATEYQVKALFLLNFMRFVEWPPAAFPEASSPLIVGIVGGSPLGPLLAEAFKAEAVRGRPLLAKELGPADDLAQCHVIFVSEAERGRTREVLLGLSSASVLTVGESEQFCEEGGMINLVTQNNGIRFDINPSAAGRAGLHVSSKLLNLARAVVPTPPAPASSAP